MLAFSGCYYGGGEKERIELGEIRKRWETLPVRISLLFSYSFSFSTIMELNSLRRISQVKLQNKTKKKE